MEPLRKAPPWRTQSMAFEELQRRIGFADDGIGARREQGAQQAEFGTGTEADDDETAVGGFELENVFGELQSERSQPRMTTIRFFERKIAQRLFHRGMGARARAAMGSPSRRER